MRAFFLLLAALCAGLPACATVPRPDAASDDSPAPIAYAALAREREEALRVELRGLLAEVLPRVEALKSALQADLAELQVPVVFAARYAELRSWHTDEVAAYREEVGRLFGERQTTLRELFDRVLQRGAAAASARAPARSPLDFGLTGDPLLDRQFESFQETLEGEFAFEDLEAEHQRWRLRTTNLFESYNAFGDDEALAALGGRLILFVGDGADGFPVACLVLELDAGRAPESRGFAQVVRHRVLRGNTVVADEGWRTAPLRPELEVRGRYVIASDLAPRLDATQPGFEQLLTKRVVVDLQTAVFDETAAILGGVNWQLEFQVTGRGGVSWQMSGASPAFDARCAELRGLLAAG